MPINADGMSEDTMSVFYAFMHMLLCINAEERDTMSRLRLDHAQQRSLSSNHLKRGPRFHGQVTTRRYCELALLLP